MPMGTVGLSSFAPHGDVLVLTSNQLFFLDGTMMYLRLEMNECLSIAQVEACSCCSRCSCCQSLW